VIRFNARPCPGPHPNEDPPLTSQALCDPCINRTHSALRNIPELYVHLYLALEPGRGARVERTSTGEAASPIHLDAEDLMRDMVDTLSGWAETARSMRGLTHPGRRPAKPSRPAPTVPIVARTVGRDPHTGETITTEEWIERHPVLVRQQPPDATAGWAVQAACQVIDIHLDTLLAGAESQPALEILDLKHRARQILGHTRQRRTLHGKVCPQCKAAALVQLTGDIVIECGACGGVWTDEQYHRYVQMVTALRDQLPPRQTPPIERKPLHGKRVLLVHPNDLRNPAMLARAAELFTPLVPTSAIQRGRAFLYYETTGAGRYVLDTNQPDRLSA
jgi:ribosomal protein L37AE/L43A